MKTKKMPADYSSIEDRRTGYFGTLANQFKARAARKEQTMKALQEKKKTKQQKDAEHIRSYNLDRQGSSKSDVSAARKDASAILQNVGKKVRLGKSR